MAHRIRTGPRAKKAVTTIPEPELELKISTSDEAPGFRYEIRDNTAPPGLRIACAGFWLELEDILGWMRRRMQDRHDARREEARRPLVPAADKRSQDEQARQSPQSD